MKYIFLTFLVTISALAQPVIGPEVASAPMDGVGEFALAPQRDGFVVAWEQNGRIHVGRLDSALQLEGGTVQLPIAEEGRIASSPSLATNGTSALVTWHEYAFGQPDTNVVATVRVDTLSLLHGPQKLDAVATLPVTAWDGASYVVYSAGYQYRLTDALDLSLVRGWPNAMSAALSNLGSVATATQDWGLELPCFHFLIGGHGDCTYPITYRFRVESGEIDALFSVVVKESTTVPLLPPIVAANGVSFTSLVRVPAMTDVLFFDNAIRTRTTLPVTILTDAAIAGNGGDALVVWTGQTLSGMFVRADGNVSEPFSISGNSADEPHVIAAGSNTFVVFYRINLGPNRFSIAGRVIRRQPSKQRAIR